LLIVSFVHAALSVVVVIKVRQSLLVIFYCFPDTSSTLTNEKTFRLQLLLLI
jgi:hypothetical protein